MDQNYCSEKTLPLCLCNFSEIRTEAILNELTGFPSKSWWESIQS